MAVIAATLAQEAKRAAEKIQNGTTLQALLAELRESTRQVQFEDNGYSK